MPIPAWTSPPDWAAGYVVLDSDLDTYLSDNLLFLYNRSPIRRVTSFPVGPVDGDAVWRTDYTPWRLYVYQAAWQLVVGSVGARAYNNAAISVNNGAATALALNSERFDTDAFHSTSSNTSRLTVPAGLGGLYIISCSLSFAANGTGVRSVQILLNGVTTIALTTLASAGAGNNTDVAAATIYQLSVGDYIEVTAFQNSGGALNVVAGGNYSPELAMIRIGA